MLGTGSSFGLVTPRSHMPAQGLYQGNAQFVKLWTLNLQGLSE